MSSSSSAGKAAAAHGLDLNFAATAFENREPSPEAASNPLVDVPGGSVSETLSRADGPKAGDGSSGGAGIFGGGVRGLNLSAEAEDSFVEARPDFEEGDGVAEKAVQEADLRTTGETLTTAVDIVQKDLNLVVPVVEAESLDRSFVEEKARNEGGSGDFVAADVGVVKGVNTAKAKWAVMPPVDGKVKDKDVVMANAGFDVVMADKKAEGDSKLGVEISASTVVEIAESLPPNVMKCQDVSPNNDGGCQKTEVVQRLEVDEKVPQVKDNMDGFDMDMGSNAVQNVQVGGQEISKSREKQRLRTSDVENNQHVRYYYAFQDEKKDGFSVLDMVWGKVRSHPWWPGQIFDPSDASEMALKHEKKDHFLVAYFGDKTFAWCDESRLKPFQTYFSHMDKQSSSDAFASAVNDALGEVSRRIELGMMCHCFTDDACADMKHQKVENAGIQEGTCSPAVDSSLIASSFQPERLLEYIHALAQFPNGEADSLELLIAKAQIRSFYRSKGYTELPVFVIGGGLENDVETTPARKRISVYDVADLSTPISSDSIFGRGKRGRGRPPKQKNILEDGRKQKSLSELMDEKHVPHHGDSGRSGSGARASSRSSGRNKIVDSDSTGSRKIKKKRLDLLGDLETKSRSPSRKRYSKVGESTHRVGSRMEGSPLILHKRKSETFQKSPAKVNGRGDDVVDDTNTHAETPKGKRGASKDFPPPSETLSQLCLAARDPMKRYSFHALIVSFFTDFRDSLASSSFKDKKLVEAVRGKRGRRKSTNSISASEEMFQPDLVQDSYWSDVIFSESPEKEPVSSDQKTEGEPQTKRQKKKRKSEEQPLGSVPSGLVVDISHHLQVDLASIDNGQGVLAERPMNNLVENTEDCMPTALILSFTESDVLPSESDLISIFGRYGSLKEEETEVLKKANRAKVVFKRRADAEVAFSSAGKYSIFGPALVSYRLRYLPSTPKTSPSSTSQGKNDAFPTEGIDLEVSAQEDPRAVDDMHAEPQGNGSSE